jgi:V-type H+-transporting ATPase proteolipid subunit
MAIMLCCLGASYGIAKSSIAICAVSVLHPDNMIRSEYISSLDSSSSLLFLLPWPLPFTRSPNPDLMPPILAGIVAIYGLVVSVLILNSLEEKSALHTNFMMLGAGLSVGMSGLAAGLSIGIVGDAGVRASALQPKLFVTMIMILIFAEVLGLYGTIIAIMFISKATQNVTDCL